MTTLSALWIKPIIVSTLLLTIASCTTHGVNTSTENKTTKLTNANLLEAKLFKDKLPESCGEYYQAVMNMPDNDIVSTAPVTVDKVKADEIEALRKLIDEQVMDKDVKDIPVSGSGLNQREAKYALKYLYAHYYLGEYVPKNDYYAKKYLGKIFEFFEDGMSDQSVIGLMYALSDDVEVVSENNPTWNHIDDNEMAQLWKLFIEAGSTETEAMLLEDGFSSETEDCQAIISERLETLEK